MTDSFPVRLRVAAASVTRAVRLGFTHDAADAVTALRADLQDRGRVRAAETALLQALEDAGARRKYAADLLEWLIAAGRGEAVGRPPADRYEKPELPVHPDGLPQMIDWLESALADARLGLFWQGGRLVCVAPVAEADGGESVRLFEVDEDLLVDFGTEAATWLMPGRENTGDGKPVNCPKHVARGLLARRGIARTVSRAPGVRLHPLTAIACAPTLRSDGSLLDLPGYDAATGLFLAFGGTRFPTIPDRPSMADAAAAFDHLAALVAEVHFVDPPSRAVALSAILTALIRPALPAAPMHAISATTFGTGKSYLTDLITCIATGRRASPIAAGATDDELEKRLAAALMAGQPVIVLDNVTRAVNGDLLNQVLTQERVSPRRLGKSELADIKSTSVMLMNGNNLTIPADMTRRVLLCSLDAGAERPELIERKHDPIAMVQADRGSYVAAGLTVLRAYIHAGRPESPKPIGSFEAWSGLVRGALLWLGEADPVSSMESVRAADPRRQEIVSIMAQWDEAIGNARVTISDVIGTAINSPEFREALLAVAGERGAISGMRLGRWLGRHRGRIVDGRKFETGAQRKGSATWVLDGGRDVSRAASVHDLHALVA